MDFPALRTGSNHRLSAPGNAPGNGPENLPGNRSVPSGISTPGHPAHGALAPRHAASSARADSTANRPRVPAPQPMAHPHYGDVMAILSRYGDGEDFEALQRTLPNIGSYLTRAGEVPASPGGKRLLQELDDSQIDYLKTHVLRRIDRCNADPGVRRFLITRLESAVQAARKAREEMLQEELSLHRSTNRPKDTRVRDIALRRLLDNPDALLKLARDFGNAALSFSQVCARNGVPEPVLQRLINQDTGNIKDRGNAFLSHFAPPIQAAFRAGIQGRFQATPEPPPGGHPALRRDHSFNAASFFSGVSAELRQMGHGAAPGSPGQEVTQPPHADLHGGLPMLPERPDTLVAGRQEDEPPSPSFFSGVIEEWQRMGHGAAPGSPGQEVTQPWHAARPGGLPMPSERPDTPVGSRREDAPPSPSFFSGVIEEWQRMGHGAAPGSPGQEVTQPRRATPAAGPAGPDWIALDDLPSPRMASPRLPPVTADSWLKDGHLLAYTEALARQWKGHPHAERLHVADPQQVAQLISGTPKQRDGVRRRLPHGPESIVFLPINDPQVHWSLLVIDRRTGGAFHYDSSRPPQGAGDVAHTRQYQLARAAATAMGIAAPVQGMPIAQQQDRHSCGDHVLAGIATLAHRVIGGTFDQTGGTDLSGIAPNRAHIASVLAGNGGAPPGDRARPAPEPLPGRQKKKPRAG
ncbi:Ulp1 family isopeptidase [Acidovorax sp. NCPPB 4044]|uniref:Ulp1 family isopeptidase n=1 Tax=Acidovorax sp. NCPPB 4044 TaxID=2940490 RepID=UPI0023043958|nr:Ulp1 family isopeptidase [Acidovorax sp. NCPPB 4044]MDA8519201.1 C48 family peptidase [Acidovorax sp. NCPPB 4044]